MVGDWWERESCYIGQLRGGLQKSIAKHPMIFLLTIYAPWLSGLSLSSDPSPDVQGH